ncbi:hypothetical protein JW887_02475 [Candidatus Dojkabacteria bacterium]|nr:hypothetical protein [Candidatus Dojkabacteria bacterium]
MDIKKELKKIIKVVKNNDVIFGILTFLSCLFLLKGGIWLFNDAAYWPKTWDEGVFNSFTQFKTFVLSNTSYGFDLGLLSYTRYISVLFHLVLYALFGSTISQIIFIVSAFILNYLAFYKFSGIWEKDSNIRKLSSIFFSFCPIFLGLMNQSYIHSYAAIPLLVFFIYKYFQSKVKKSIKYILLIIVCLYLITGYLRFIQITAIIAAPYLIYLTIKHKWYKQYQKIFALFIPIALAFLPSIYLLINQYIKGTSSVYSNFASSFEGSKPELKWYEIFSIYQTINIPIYSNYPLIYGIIGTSVLGILLITALLTKGKTKSAFYLNLGMIALSIILIALPLLFQQNIYDKLVKIFAFLQNVPQYGLYLSTIPIAMLIIHIARKNYVLAKVYTLIIVAIAIFPLLSINAQYLAKIKVSDIPQSYVDEFVDNDFNEYPEPTLFIPQSCWNAEYTREESTTCINKSIIDKDIQDINPRFLSSSDYQLQKRYTAYQNLSPATLENLKVTHNLKNIIVAKDIIEPTYWVSDANQMKLTLDKFDDLEIYENDQFTKYTLLENDTYDFFIYSPNYTRQFIENESTNDMVDITQKPVFTDQIINADFNQNVNVDYKMSNYNPEKYYAKISNFDNNKDILLQTNLLYNPNWKIKFITKQEYDSVNCYDKQEFDVTDNSRCKYNGTILPALDIKYLFSKEVSTGQHKIGNILGNLWIIDNEQLEGKNEVYAVIIFEKQIPFTWSIYISTAVMTLLFMISVYSEIKFKKKSDIQTNIHKPTQNEKLARPKTTDTSQTTIYTTNKSRKINTKQDGDK